MSFKIALSRPSAQPLAPDRNCACARPAAPLVHCSTCHAASIPGPSLLGKRPVYCQAPSRFGGRCLQDLASVGDMEMPARAAATKPKASRANLGKPLEAAIAAGCKLYRAQGRARVAKVPTLWVRRGEGQFGRKSTGRCDFVGTLAGGARACEFEAKTTIAERWPIAMISEMQRKRLDQLEQLGGLAGVVVRVAAGTAEEADFWLPWRAVVAHEAAGGARTLPAESLAALGVRLATKGRALLWLDAAQAITGGAL